MINTQLMTRDGFGMFFIKVFSTPVPNVIETHVEIKYASGSWQSFHSFTGDEHIMVCPGEYED